MAAGTLSFAAGDTTKTFQVLIVDNAYPQGNHVFSLQLTNPTGGASLGDSRSAGVTIIDNDTNPPTCPAANSLRAAVTDAVRKYLDELDGQMSIDVYQMVLAEIEEPLLDQ